MQRNLIPALLLLAAPLATPAHAQEGPQPPAAELQKLAPMLGTWESKGTAVMAPGMPAAEWTSKSTSQWALGGHALQGDMRIAFAEEGMGDLVFRTYMTFDRERGRFVSFDINNMGAMSTTDIHFSADGAIIAIGQGFDETGQVTAERWVTRYKGDTMEFTSQQAVGSGDFFVHVTGTGKRTSKKVSNVSIANAGAFMPTPPPAEMVSIAKMAGNYTMKGSMIPAPGAPMMKISGNEQAQVIMGGTILMFSTKGDPSPDMGNFVYEGTHFIGWDAANKCYMHFGLNNMGDAHKNEARWVGKSLVFTGSVTMNGTPVVNRSILDFDDSGAMTRFTAHSLMGTAEPLLSFKATYEKK